MCCKDISGEMGWLELLRDIAKTQWTELLLKVGESRKLMNLKDLMVVLACSPVIIFQNYSDSGITLWIAGKQK